MYCSVSMYEQQFTYQNWVKVKIVKSLFVTPFLQTKLRWNVLRVAQSLHMENRTNLNCWYTASKENNVICLSSQPVPGVWHTAVHICNAHSMQASWICFCPLQNPIVVWMHQLVSQSVDLKFCSSFSYLYRRHFWSLQWSYCWDVMKVLWG